MNVLDSLKDEIKKIVDGDSAHDFEHVMRVYKNAKKICKQEKMHIVKLGFDLQKFVDDDHKKRCLFRKEFNLVYDILHLVDKMVVSHINFVSMNIRHELGMVSPIPIDHYHYRVGNRNLSSILDFLTTTLN